MQTKNSPFLFFSSKLELKIVEQFLYYTFFRNQNTILIVDLFFKNFTQLNIKVLICCLFILDCLFVGNFFSIKITRYKIKREKRTAVTIRWSIDNMLFFHKLFMLILPKVIKDSIYIPSMNEPISSMVFTSNTILSMVPYLLNYRQFKKYFEFEKIILNFSFSLVSLKHNYILKNYLSYLGFLVI